MATAIGAGCKSDGSGIHTLTGRQRTIPSVRLARSITLQQQDRYSSEEHGDPKSAIEWLNAEVSLANTTLPSAANVP